MERKGLLTCLTALQVITFLSCNLIGRSTKTGVEVGDQVTLRSGSAVYVSLANYPYQVRLNESFRVLFQPVFG